MNEEAQGRVYQRIGEFVVSFQYLENQLREIGWLILDPKRRVWPPQDLREESAASLFSKVEKLFLEALPRCDLGEELEEQFRTGFKSSVERLAKVRRARNSILHSAFIELKAGGEVVGLMRSDPKGLTDSETGKKLFNPETLSERSFEDEMREMAHLSMFFGRCYIQLISRLPSGET